MYAAKSGLARIDSAGVSLFIARGRENTQGSANAGIATVQSPALFSNNYRLSLQFLYIHADLIIFALIIAYLLSCLQYAVGEKVRLWVNKVGPYNNPQETYNYYYLPFCAPRADEKATHKWGGLGEVLGGNELIDSQLDIKFRCELFPFPLNIQCCDIMSLSGLCHQVVGYDWKREAIAEPQKMTPILYCKLHDPMSSFAADIPKQSICTTKLDDKSVQAFQNAIKKYYW